MIISDVNIKMMVSVLIAYIFLISLGYSEVYRTLNDYDKTIAEYCMDNKDPMIPSTYSCEDYHQSEISSMYSTVTQMLNKVDTSNELSDSLYPTFPALSTGIFNMHGSSPYSTSYVAKHAVFNALIGSEVGCWRTSVQDTSQYILMGSSVPFVFEKLVTAGSGSLNLWVTSFILYYSLDNGSWIKYGDTFYSNTDDNSLFELTLNPFVARAIRIHPISWNSGIAMRIEVYVSKHDYKYQISKMRTFYPIYYGYNVVFSKHYSDSWSYEGMHFYSYIHYETYNNEWIIVSAGYLMMWSRLTILYNSEHNSEFESIRLLYSTNGADWFYYNGGSSIYPDSNSNIYLYFTIYAISMKVIFYGPTLYYCFNLDFLVSEA